MTIAIWAPIVFCTALLIDYAHAHYVRNSIIGQAHRASQWSIIQWAAGCLGLVLAFKVSLYLLPFEGLGLYVGSYLGIRQQNKVVAYIPPIRLVPPRLEEKQPISKQN